MNRSMTLPLDVLFLIVEFATAFTEDSTLESLDSASEFPNAPKKQSFAGLMGLSGACRLLYLAVRKMWFCTLYIRDSADWELSQFFGVCEYVREIRVLSNSLTERIPKSVFLRFPNLHTAFIDAHNDFSPAEQAASQNRPASLGRYSLLTSNLPQSLRRLWVVNAHGPDAAVIRALHICCPQIEELSISRCTMFSPRMREGGENSVLETCAYWSLFPEEHDSYFSTEGIQAYTESLAHELKPLSSLKKLHMGLYLSPHASIEQHRAFHASTTPCASIWEERCDECTVSYSVITKATETRANRVIFSSNSGLTQISWASFFTTGRTGATSYTRPMEDDTEAEVLT